MASVSGLSVRVSAATASFRRGISSAQETAQDLSLSLRRMGAAASAAERDLDSAGRSALTTAGHFTTLTLGTEGLNFSLGRLSTTIAVSLVPAVVTLAGALVPLVTALGGFIAIGAAVGGVGLAGLIGAIATNTDQLKSSFMAVVDTFQDVFEPAITAATLVLSNLLNRLEQIAPELALSQDEIFNLTNLFTDLGATLIEFLPTIVDLGVALTEEFLPGFIQFVEDVGPQLPGMVRSMVSAFRRVLPLVVDFGREVGDLLPQLLDFGFAALPVVASALGTIGNVVGDALTWFNSLDQSIQDLILRASLIAPIFTTIAALIGGISAPITALIAGVGLLALAWQRDVGQIRTIVSDFSAAISRVLGDRIPSLLDSARDAWEAWAPVIVPILEGITGVLGLLVTQGLDSVLTTLEIILDVLSGDFGEALNSFVSLWERSITRIAEFINRFTGGMLQTLANDTIMALNTIGSGLEDFAEFVGEGDRFQFERFEEIQIGTTPFRTEEATPQTPRMSQRAQADDTPIEVNVTGDTGVVEEVSAQRAELVVQQQNDRATRNSGTGL